nr:7890_t:CDS:2 [Entrophospora candida]
MQSNKVEITDKILDPKMIEAMDRKELQAHCKKFGYKANLKNETLKEMLLHRTMRQIGIGIEEGDYNASDILQRSFKRYCELQQQQKIELNEVAEEYLTLGETVKETEPAEKLLTIDAKEYLSLVRPTKRKKTEPIESTSTSPKKQRITITRTTTKAVGKKPVAKRKIVVKNDEQKKKEEFLQRREASRNVLENGKKAKKRQLDHEPPSYDKKVKD